MTDLKFYTGQKVHCNNHGNGEVFAIYKEHNFPIKVIFRDGNTASYLFDGREYSKYEPSLKPEISEASAGKDVNRELLEALIYLYDKMDDADSAMMATNAEHLYEYEKWEEIRNLIQRATQTK